MDYKETIKERLNELSPELRSFVLNENWRRETEKIGKQFNFDEEKYASFENEVFLVLLCFEPKTDFSENITKELGIDSNTAGWIAEDVEKEIFSKMANELDSMWGNMTEEEPIENQTPQSGVGQSFEQIILNQAKAMQPAFASPELGYGVAKPAVDEQRREAPTNLPTSEQNQSEQSRAIHNYIGESDPYREPIE